MEADISTCRRAERPRTQEVRQHGRTRMRRLQQGAEVGERRHMEIGGKRFSLAGERAERLVLMRSLQYLATIPGFQPPRSSASSAAELMSPSMLVAGQYRGHLMLPAGLAAQGGAQVCLPQT